MSVRYKIQDLLFRVYRIIGRVIIKYSWDKRPATYPFITGDGFRKIANHVYDSFHPKIDTSKIKSRDIVFIGDSHIKFFLKQIHPNIKNPYILITHNGDENIDDECSSLIDDKILRWYGINITTHHHKITPLPLGIANKHYYVAGIPSLYNKVNKKHYSKKCEIFYGFLVETNPKERQAALDILKNLKTASTIDNWVNFAAYLHLLAKYMFVASPPGSSIEGHRTWEALYIGVIPIVKRSITTEYFEKIGVPVWVVNEWDELKQHDSKSLTEKFNHLSKNSDWSLLKMNYWINKIRNIEE